MKTRWLGGIVGISMLCSCGSQSDAAPGINSREMQVLQESWNWKPGNTSPKYSTGELVALMDISAYPKLDGEYAEAQATALSISLASVGDKCFAKTLATRNRDVQVSVIHYIDYMWTHYKLRYPRTQAIARMCQKDKKNGPNNPYTPQPQP